MARPSEAISTGELNEGAFLTKPYTTTKSTKQSTGDTSQELRSARKNWAELRAEPTTKLEWAEQAELYYNTTNATQQQTSWHSKLQHRYRHPRCGPPPSRSSHSRHTLTLRARQVTGGATTLESRTPHTTVATFVRSRALAASDCLAPRSI
jgi:hypothetical protein